MEVKAKTFRNERVDLCRHCQGVGFVNGGEGGQVLPTCPVCGGSGRVWKITEGTVTIKKYEDDNSH